VGFIKDKDFNTAIQRFQNLCALLLAHRNVHRNFPFINLKTVFVCNRLDAFIQSGFVNKNPFARLNAQGNILCQCV